MAITPATIGNGATTTTGTSIATTLTAAVAVNDVITVAVAIDNTGTSGAAPASLTCADSKGNKYFRVSPGLVDPGVASAGAYGCWFVAICTTAMTTSDTITVTTGATAAIAVNCYKTSPSAGKVIYFGTVGGSTATAGTSASTGASASLATGTVIFGMAAIERGNATKNLAVTGDSDTSNGSWSTQQASQGNNSSTSTSDMTCVSQYKVVTGAGTQTFDVSWTTATDAVIRYLTMTEGDPLIPGVVIPWHHGFYAEDALQTPPADGAAAASWRSGGMWGGTIAQGTGARQPLYRATGLGGNAALDFDGSDDSFEMGFGDQLVQTFSLVTVLQTDAGAAQSTNPMGLGGGVVLDQGAVGTGQLSIWAGGTSNCGNGSDLRGSPHWSVAVYNDSSSKQVVDGTTYNAGSATGTNAAQWWVMAAYSTGNGCWAGLMSAALLYPGDITAHPNYSDLTTWLTNQLAAGLTLNAATETDSASALSNSKTKDLGAASETDAGATLALSKTFTLGYATETDAAQTLSESKALTLNSASETDAAYSVSRISTITYATETDAAQPVSLSKTITLGAATEADTSSALTLSREAKTLSTATETDTGSPLALTKSQTLTTAAETDQGQALVPSKTQAGGTAAEVDAAAPLSFSRGAATLTTASEVDAGQALAPSKLITLGYATETDQAWPLPSTTTVLTTASESDAAQPATVTKVITLGVATETDASSALSESKSATLTTAAESDLGQPLVESKTATTGTATEADASAIVGLSKSTELGTALETDAALPLESGTEHGLGTANETDAPQSITLAKVVSLGSIGEVDSIPSLSISKGTIVLGTATETNAPQSLAQTKTRRLAFAHEVDGVLVLSNAKVITTSTATETDTAQTLVLIQISGVLPFESRLSVSQYGSALRVKSHDSSLQMVRRESNLRVSVFKSDLEVN